MYYKDQNLDGKDLYKPVLKRHETDNYRDFLDCRFTERGRICTVELCNTTPGLRITIP